MAVPFELLQSCGGWLPGAITLRLDTQKRQVVDSCWLGEVSSIQVKILRGKIQRATVTGSDLHYEGSITIDRALMRAADILPYQEVEVWNIANGERLQTYAIPGVENSGVVCLNGAAARKAAVGDAIIVAAYGWLSAHEAGGREPRIVKVDIQNRIIEAN